MTSFSDSEAFRLDQMLVPPIMDDAEGSSPPQDHIPDGEKTTSNNPYDSDMEDMKTVTGLRLTFQAGEVQIAVVNDITDVEERIRSRRRKLRKRTTEATQRLKQKKRLLKKEKKKIAKKEQKKKTPGQVGKSSKKRMNKKESHPLHELVMPEATFEASMILPEVSQMEENQYEKLRVKVAGAIPGVLVVDSGDTIEALLDKELKQKQHKSAFYLMHLGFAVQKYIQWTKLLPRVMPFYAVKCNPDPHLVQTLLLCGTGLDCASRGEIELALSLKCPPQNIIFANPCKKIDDVIFAKQQGITMMTFDNESELDKIKAVYPEAEMILRILSDDSHSIMAFGTKFGATQEEAEELLEHARKLEIKVIGLSFHVGSGCLSAEGYVNTLSMARGVFDMARDVYGFDFKLLDIGGGWPGVDTAALSFEQLAIPVAQALDDLFPNVRIIAEPGRYFAAETITLATNIIARRGRKTKEEKPQQLMQYYISDGVYGSFNNIFFDHAAPRPSILKRVSSAPDIADNVGKTLEEETTCSSTLFGPTCDSIDVICKDVQLPKLGVGDWLYFMNMGAYTRAAASSFNGISPPNTTYII